MMATLNFIEQGLRVLDVERQALSDIAQYVDENFGKIRPYWQ